MTESILMQPSISAEPDSPGTAVVKIIGLGGGGSNAINRMIELGLDGVDFIAANTDAQALASSLAATRIQLGPRVTRGLGAGGDPKIGAAAAMESSRELARALSGADMVFLTAGLGGGTGRVGQDLHLDLEPARREPLPNLRRRRVHRRGYPRRRLRHQRGPTTANPAPRAMLSRISQGSRVLTVKKTKSIDCLLSLRSRNASA